MKANKYHSPSTIIVALVSFSLLISACASSAPQSAAVPTAPSVPKIAFSAWKADTAIPNNEIFSMNLDGTGLVDLTNNDASDTYPAYSPDGKQIAFCSDRAGKSELYIMNEDGTNQHRITDQIPDCGNPSWSVPVWSPDDKWIGIPSTASQAANNQKMDIFLLKSDESKMYNLTNNAASEGSFSWSPDSQQIAFASNRDGNYEIYTVGIDGRNLTRLTNNSTTDSLPAWSPDGQRIAYTSNWQGALEIYVMNTDGSNQVRLTSDISASTNPVWSPDGKTIFYTTNKDGNVEIYRMSADGSNQTNLTNSSVDDYWFWLSPDGSQVAFSSCVANCLAGQATWNTSVMNSDGTNQRELLKSQASISFKP